MAPHFSQGHLGIYMVNISIYYTFSAGSIRWESQMMVWIHYLDEFVWFKNFPHWFKHIEYDIVPM